MSEFLPPQDNAFEGGADQVLHAVFDEPIDVAKLSPRRQKDVALAPKREQVFTEVYQQRLLDCLPQATTADDLQSIVLAEAQIQEWRDHVFFGESRQRLITGILDRAGVLAVDPETGMADPDDIVELVMPAVTTFMETPALWLPQADIKGREDQFDKYQAVFSRYFKARLIHGTEGVAESIAAYRVRDRLHEAGFPGMGRTKVSAGWEYKKGSQYFTRQTMQLFTDSGVYDYESVPEGRYALTTGVDLVKNTLKELRDSGHNIAGQILGAYERVAITAGRYEESIAKVSPISTEVTIANALTTTLNKQAEFAGENALDRLDVNQPGDIVRAFERMLYAIDPALLAEATTPVDLLQASPLRLKMIFLEGLMANWEETRRRKTGLTVGDYVMRLAAQGLSGEQLAKKVQQRIDKTGNPADAATSKYQQTRRDSETKGNHVEYRRSKPGYGVIS